MQMDDRLVPAKDVVAREVGGETVLLDLSSGTYFGLNEVGNRIWFWIETDGCTLGEISERLHSEFDVSAKDAQSDVFALAQSLVEHGLLQPQG